MGKLTKLAASLAGFVLSISTIGLGIFSSNTTAVGQDLSTDSQPVDLDEWAKVNCALTSDNLSESNTPFYLSGIYQDNQLELQLGSSDVSYGVTEVYPEAFHYPNPSSSVGSCVRIPTDNEEVSAEQPATGMVFLGAFFFADPATSKLPSTITSVESVIWKVDSIVERPGYDASNLLLEEDPLQTGTLLTAHPAGQESYAIFTFTKSGFYTITVNASFTSQGQQYLKTGTYTFLVGKTAQIPVDLPGLDGIEPETTADTPTDSTTDPTESTSPSVTETPTDIPSTSSTPVTTQPSTPDTTPDTAASTPEPPSSTPPTVPTTGTHTPAPTPSKTVSTVPTTSPTLPTSTPEIPTTSSSTPSSSASSSTSIPSTSPAGNSPSSSTAATISSAATASTSTNTANPDTPPSGNTQPKPATPNPEPNPAPGPSPTATPSASPDRISPSASSDNASAGSTLPSITSAATPSTLAATRPATPLNPWSTGSNPTGKPTTSSPSTPASAAASDRSDSSSNPSATLRRGNSASGTSTFPSRDSSATSPILPGSTNADAESAINNNPNYLGVPSANYKGQPQTASRKSSSGNSTGSTESSGVNTDSSSSNPAAPQSSTNDQNLAASNYSSTYHGTGKNSPVQNDSLSWSSRVSNWVMGLGAAAALCTGTGTVIFLRRRP